MSTTAYDASWWIERRGDDDLVVDVSIHPDIAQGDVMRFNGSGMVLSGVVARRRKLKNGNVRIWLTAWKWER